MLHGRNTSAEKAAAGEYEEARPTQAGFPEGTETGWGEHSSDGKSTFYTAASAGGACSKRSRREAPGGAQPVSSPHRRGRSAVSGGGRRSGCPGSRPSLPADPGPPSPTHPPPLPAERGGRYLALRPLLHKAGARGSHSGGRGQRWDLITAASPCLQATCLY